MKNLLARCFMAVLVTGLGVMAASAATQTVSVANFSFTPQNLTVTNGDTVQWTVVGSHTVSPRSGVTDPFCGSGVIASCSRTFTNLGTFLYQCNFHGSMLGSIIVVAAPGVPPVVSITNPPNNTLFAAPATVSVGISASDSDGSIASVQLLTNGVFALTNTVAPFGFNLSNLAAGFYTLRARATDNQSLSATSAPVNLRVASAPVLTFAPGTNGPLAFQFHTVTGVSYVVEGGGIVTNVPSLAHVTNPGTGGAQQFTVTNPAPSQGFFRVRLE